MRRRRGVLLVVMRLRLPRVRQQHVLELVILHVVTLILHLAVVVLQRCFQLLLEVGFRLRRRLGLLLRQRLLLLRLLLDASHLSSGHHGRETLGQLGSELELVGTDRRPRVVLLRRWRFLKLLQFVQAMVLLLPLLLLRNVGEPMVLMLLLMLLPMLLMLPVLFVLPLLLVLLVLWMLLLLLLMLLLVLGRDIWQFLMHRLSRLGV